MTMFNNKHINMRCSVTRIVMTDVCSFRGNGLKQLTLFNFHELFQSIIVLKILLSCVYTECSESHYSLCNNFFIFLILIRYFLYYNPNMVLITE